MNILISACLLGENCKYNGGNNLNEKLRELIHNHRIFPVCPEMMGGLPCPRPPAEIVDGEVININKVSVDKAFRKGADSALKIALDNKIDLAILQSRSPSCGLKEIYDGSFTGKLTSGQGVFAKLLLENNIKVFDIEDIEEIEEFLKKHK